MIGSGGGRWDAPLKSTVRAQNTIKLNCAMNDSFFLFLFLFFYRRLFFSRYVYSLDFFFCLRRSRFVVGARENGLGARPNFLYAGKTLYDHVTLKAEIYIYDSVTPCSRSCLDGLVFIYGSPTVVGGPN